MRPRVAVLSFSHLETDPRIRKQIELLAPEHDVLSIGHGPAPEGVVEHVEVPAEHAIWRYPRHLVVSRQYARAYSGNAAIAFVREHVAPGQVDLVVANDVDAAGVALALRPRHGVHLDLHEFAPEQNSEMWRFRTFVAPFLRWQLRTFATRAAATTTVCRSIADRYRDEFGLDPGVVMNAAAYRDLEPRATGDVVRLVHAGAALRNRRLEVMIDAVGRAAAEGAPVSLDVFLMPNQPDYLTELTERARTHPAVSLHPPLDHASMVEAMAEYDVGVHVLAPTNYNNAVALPNKFFDFVQARLGLVIGPSPEMAQLTREHGFGAVAEDFSTEALTRVVANLTPTVVDEWKAASSASAYELSAQRQAATWQQIWRSLLD